MSLSVRHSSVGSAGMTLMKWVVRSEPGRMRRDTQRTYDASMASQYTAKANVKLKILITMEIQQKLEMLIEYEKLDAPTTKKERLGWSMYMANKIVNFLGTRELSLAYGYSPESLSDNKLPNIYQFVHAKLIH